MNDDTINQGHFAKLVGLRSNQLKKMENQFSTLRVWNVNVLISNLLKNIYIFLERNSGIEKRTSKFK